MSGIPIRLLLAENDRIAITLANDSFPEKETETGQVSENVKYLISHHGHKFLRDIQWPSQLLLSLVDGWMDGWRWSLCVHLINTVPDSISPWGLSPEPRVAV